MPDAPSLCPQVLYAGACTTPACALQHDAAFCDICGVIITPASAYQLHVDGSRHRAQSAALAAQHSTSIKCPLCNVVLTSASLWTSHSSGRPHLREATKRGVSPNVTPQDPNVVPAGHRRCGLCKRNINDQGWSSHLEGQPHKNLEARAIYQGALETAGNDRHGASVAAPGSADVDLDFNVVELDDAQRGVERTLSVRQNKPGSRITLVQVKIAAAATSAPCPFSIAVDGGLRALVYNMDVTVRVTLRHAHRGRYEALAELVFEDASRRRFAIVRQVRAIVGTPADHQDAGPAPAQPGAVVRKRVAWKPANRFFPGRRPPAIDAVPWTKKLRMYPIPTPVIEALKTKGSTEEIAAYFRTNVLPRALNAAGHTQHFKILLWIEEFRAEQDLRVYDLADVALTKEGTLFFLPVPGLAEKRPSVLIGDRFELQSSAFDSDKCYEGWVHVVRLDTVGLAFHSSFKPSAGQRFNVRFKLNRVPLRRQHEALGVLAPPAPHLLFPTAAHAGLANVPTTADSPLALFNTLLASNPEQLQAVRTILHMNPGRAPFIVFGPPGTGKTVTVVEAIRQIIHHKPNARILACAPSNSAADILAQRLTMLGADVLFRYYAVSRDRAAVPPELLAFTHVTPGGFFSVPPTARLAQFRVVVATCGSASFAHGVGMRAGHFSHVVVDEAGQASEAEVMTPIKTMLTPSTTVVLSGDPQQLGPVIRSAVARELGFGVSFLERIMGREVYGLQTYRGRTIVKLVRNFRSHNAIIAFPSEKFYGNELRPCGDPAVINSFVNSPVLVNRKFPVVFHAISGKDARESTSPSYFNIDEMGVDVEYTKKLLADRNFRIAPEDIGHISPYQAHVRKLRTALRGFAPESKVGSVEEFQGQERRAIIVSTVRSSRELMAYDAKYTLGFVANPRRFNVAMTRAQALLIVIGDPAVLSIDPLWRAFLNYVHNNGGWRGDPIAWDPHAPVRAAAYDGELRAQGAADVGAFVQRMQAYAGGGGGGGELDEMAEQDVAEGEANLDRDVPEAE